MKQALVLGGAVLLAACSQAPSEDESKPAEPSVAPAVRASEAPPELSPEVKAQIAAEEKAFAAMCEPVETPIFGCSFADGKRVSVCGLPEGGAKYRFGGDEPELTLSGDTWATVPYSGGGEAQIKFTNGDTNYFVFSRMVRTNFKAGEPNSPAMSDGIIIERGGEVLTVKVCDGPDPLLPVQYFEAERFMETRRELFTYETGRADPEWANME